MVFVAFGLNHKTAPLEVREKIAISSAAENKLLCSVTNLPTVDEAAILSTCNRTEIYCETNDPDSLLPWLAEEHSLKPQALSPYIYLHQEAKGVRHGLRVASGCDSMMLGEPQIFSQMKKAYKRACEAGAVKKNLRQIFEYIFNASKRIRTHSGIGNNPISIAYAAVQLVGRTFTDYSALKVFLIGSGETATLVAKYLHKEGVKQFFVTSRTQENASALAAAFNGKALSITDMPQYLSEADVIISATTCPLPFINKGLVELALARRNNKPMFFLDLAVPRDIEPEVAQLEQVILYNIDDLQFMTERGMHERRTAATQAEQLIDFEIDNYLCWHRSLSANNLVCTYRNHMQMLAKQELKRSMTQLNNGVNQEFVLQEFCDRLLKKLVHQPTTGIKRAAYDNKIELLDLVHYLFNIDNPIPL
jgi:glutamyl-tRNA reductase